MNEQDKPCNLLVQDSDLKRLEELNPSVMNGFVKTYHEPLTVTIRFLDSDQKQIVDKQILTVSIFERGHNDPDTIKFQITSEVDLFLNLSSTITAQGYEQLRKNQRLSISFKDYVRSVFKILGSCGKSQGFGNKDNNIIELILTSNTGEASTLRVLQNTQYKVLEILNLKFYPSSLQKTNQSILFRYNFKKSKLRILQNSIESIYGILEDKNPSLLQYIVRTVGLVNIQSKQT